MTQVTFNTPVIKIDSLQNKFDTLVLSGSFVNLIGDYVEALFFQQLHYWSYSEYGVVINDVRWIYKPLREWLSEVFTFLTEWKLRKAIASLLEKGLIERKKLYVKHHEIKHDNPYWNPKNQTYYYSVNYDELQKRIDRVKNTKNAESTENVRIENHTELSVEGFQDTKCCELSQNNTENTSIENNSKNKSHPHLPCEWNNSNSVNQDKDSLNTGELSSTSKETKDFCNNSEAIDKETSSADVENKVNQDIGTTPDVESVAKPKIKNQSGELKPRRKKQAPWKDEGQFKHFYKELVKALPIVANAHSPQGLAQTIIKQLRCGIPHSYWDDFEAGQPIGTSTKPEWEITPGEPYPMFVEYLTEKIKRGDNTTSDEQTRNEVFRILNKPRQAKAFWGQFKRSVVNVARTVERDRALGVSNPNTPVWTRERLEPTISEAAVAGEKIMAVNGSASHAIAAVKTPRDTGCIPHPVQLEQSSLSDNSRLDRHLIDRQEETSDPWQDEFSSISDQPHEETATREPAPTLRELLTQKLGNRNLKGFVKAMPKVSKSDALAENEVTLRQKMNRKTHLNQMSIDEINKLLEDPITRKELTRQIIFNDKFDVVTDNLGEVLAVKVNKEYRNNGEK